MNQQFYETIFKRKSIRKYVMEPVAQETLEKIKQFSTEVEALVPGIGFEFSFLETEDVKNMLPIKAPHYICLYSEKKEHYLINAGFILQQMDLYFSTNNLASCWLGMAKPNKQVPEQKNGMEFVIMLAFGNTEEAVYRNDVSEFRRKELKEITTIPEAKELLEAVRLAPSASNTQTWFLSGSLAEMTLSREKLNLIKAPLYGRMNQIDMGIALCHLDLALAHAGKKPLYSFKKETASDTAPAGYEFMAKIRTAPLL